jgi:L-ascorbate metabolism protein UlaG (beta-lactamase superfamily)
MGGPPERGVAGNHPAAAAARLANHINAWVAIPCHYDMFEFNTASPDDFAAECKRLGQRHRVLKLGERFDSREVR